ncbi:YciI family protein [Dentiradicibacter hellwigii]|uniref:YciI family protein n=1 Tax=Dentiradicibacter hellwigii TaxID=3149053 RepID=A0ABV4UBP2_9RHOO
MRYTLIAEDRANSLAARRADRSEYLERQRALQDEGRQRLTGACPAIDAPTPGPGSFRGSLIAAEFASRAAAQRWAKHDSYVLAGNYVRLTVKPFCQVLPA